MASIPSDQELTALLSSAEEYKLSGEHEKALAILEEMLTHVPDDVDALEELAENELLLRRFPRATKAARRALDLDPQSAIAQYVLGYIAAFGREWKEAVELLQRANKRRPNHPEILRCLGFTLFFGMGEHMQGVVTMERALNLEPDNAQILCDLGLAYVHLRNFGKATSLFERALMIDPDNARVQECVKTCEEMRKKMRV